MSKPKISPAFVLRTFQRMKAIANRMSEKELAEFLTRKGVPQESPWFLGTYLDDVRQYMPDDPVPVCATCGKDWDYGRKDRCFCSARCRQRAYRKRVADNPARGGQAVTNRRVHDASASL